MKNNLKKILFDHFKVQNIVFDESLIEILNTRDEKHGDYSTNISLKVSKIFNLSPIEFAEKYISNLKHESILSIDIVKPGFVNFFINEKVLANELLEDFPFNKKITFSNNIGENINYEFVSANPTGFLHIGHARNAIIGDITVNILERLNNKVVREYYINDAGNQIAELGKSVLYHFIKLNNIDYEILEEEVGYNGYEILDYSKTLKINDVDLSKDKKEIIDDLGEKAKDYFLVEINKTLDNLNLNKFDVFTSEKSLFDTGKVDNAIKNLKLTKYVFEKDGAIWLETTKYDDDKDRVLMKSDGTFTYMVADIANHIAKFERKFDKLINLWGSDHHGYERRIKSACNFLGEKAENILVHYISMVKLFQNGKELKMSKRAGTSLTINEVLTIVNSDLIRYSMISKSREQNLSIDIDEIKKQDINNPYWYIQYANARMNSLIKKFGVENIRQTKEFTLIGKDEKKLIIKINDLEDILKHSGRISEPYILWNYLYELASYFHSYYNFSIIISDNKKLSMEKINFIKIIKNVFENIFEILNMKLIDEM